MSNKTLKVLSKAPSIKSLVLGNTVTSEAVILSAIQSNQNIQHVFTSATVDLFLLSLDLQHVFKINANFLYVKENDFNFLMFPKSESARVSNIINFLACGGVGSIVEVHNQLGKKRYTVRDIKDNLSEVNTFSGYVKHFRHDTQIYPLPIVNEMPFNSQVVAKGDYFILELPTKSLKLSEHLSYYKRVYGKELRPVSQDYIGYSEYSKSDFSFIVRLVLAYNFHAKRIAEAFNIPYEAFNGFLSAKYRYKPNHVGALDYNDPKHDLVLKKAYSNSNFFYNPYKIIIDGNVA